MIRLTNLADYAVVLMCEMSHADSRMSAQDLSAATSIPVPTVAKILNALGRAGVLNSHRGLKGGFSLAKSADDISVADIVEAIDGPIALTHCVEGGTSDCSFDDICQMRPRWQVINGAVRDALEDVKLSALVANEPDQTLFKPREAPRTTAGTK
ncbi:SUF system Fe-S cluster assembly regulator [Kordiimonas marina]|uniref:SUF system Fe-S cluster assembly regulator n=1 Tax=Kordiimonas marina TaxID=2872312 RepID=UPI001FF531BC|nr:SUF system Fe-S cluster assembly regulator [Kordiimonas marina]MCJ9430108.1 SUF system Fe-S cluster assembly regulator [Kordiimonas marina]